MHMQYLHNHVRFVNIIFKLFLNRLKRTCVSRVQRVCLYPTPLWNNYPYTPCDVISLRGK